MSTRSQCMSSGLELFSLPPLQTAIEEGQWVDYNPISSINSAAPIEFVVTGSDDYIDLSKTLIEIKAEIRKLDGTRVADTVKVAPINNTLQSLFSQLDVTLNDVTVSSSNTTYPFRSYIENHLNYGSDAKRSRLCAGMYFIDDNITIHNPIPDDGETTNTGLKQRHSMCTGKTFDMIGGLHGDVFNQDRFLLNDVTLRLRFSRSKDQFVLMSSEANPSFRIEIISAKLHIRKLKIAPNLILAHEKILATRSAKYPITRVEVKVFHLPQGQTSFTHDNLILGNLPKRLCIGIVDNASFNGSYTQNPFNFQHCDLNYLSLHLDGRQIPYAPLKLSYSTDNYIQAYFTQFTGGEGIVSDSGNSIDRTDFKNGNAIYMFDLSPDLSSSCNDHFNVTRQGNLRVELAFDKVLPFTANVVVYSEFDNVIEIDKDRNVTLDYGG